MLISHYQRILSSVVIFTVSAVTYLPLPALAKSYAVSENIKFDFKGCSKSEVGNDVICSGDFRSISGEKSLSITTGKVGSDNKRISITDSSGKVHFVDEIRVGDNWVCRANEICPGDMNGNVVLVEGVVYKTTFIFKDISLPSAKIALFNLICYTNGGFSGIQEIKIRNISTNTSQSIATLPSPSPQNSGLSKKPAKRNNWSYKINSNAIRFDFNGCTNSGSDIVCSGNFRSLNREQIIAVGPGSDGVFSSSNSISITDIRGTTHRASELRIGNDWSCLKGNNSFGNSCQMTLVEGIDYKTLFIFKDISLPSSKIALFYFNNDSYFSGTGNNFEIKIRDIDVTQNENI
jgi:hypothetical protein